jgi:cytochrome c oxidase subunit IV
MNEETELLIRRLWFRNGKILLAEFVLLGISFAAAFAPLNGYNTALNIFIAALMALIGLLFFMGLVRESTLLRLAASGGLFWLIVMFVLTFADYLTRGR